MITQNPIIGRARKKLGGVYSRTLYGMNVVQACPPAKKGTFAESQIRSQNIFGAMSRLSNQVPASLLNNIFYHAPVGRSRRAEWMFQLMKGVMKDEMSFSYIPSLLPRLGGNAAVTQEPIIIVPTQNQLRFSFAETSQLPIADTSQTPCLILICTDTNQCISLLPWTTITDDEIVCTNLSPTYLGHECYIYCLWQYNAGTAQNPIYVFGSYVKPDTP